MTNQRCFLLISLAAIALTLTLTSRNENRSPSPKLPSLSNVAKPQPQALKTSSLHLQPASSTAASTTLTNSHGDQLELALDEAISLRPDGSQAALPLIPPATPDTLRSRLAEISALPVAYPIAYPSNAERRATTRQAITPDISVKIDDVALASLLKTFPLTLKERPTYAPGWAILTAADPLAAIAACAAIRNAEGVVAADVIVAQMRVKRSLPNDTLIADQWHLANNTTNRTHANLQPIWNYPSTTGSRGTGVRIGIIDDGIDLSHPDLIDNLDTTNDRDFIGNDNTPAAESRFEDFHGNACAGVAAARGNNNLGVSGAAPNATLVGMRLITSQAGSTDAQEAEAMGWKNDIIQVKSNSWGAEDTGGILISQRPGSLALAALANATATGRSGRGTIFVWAGGNGGDSTDRDNSNYDGYANSIHAIAVAASNSSGTRSVYSEAGANIAVCAPSDGTSSQLGITTTDLVSNLGYNTSTGNAGNYTNDFGGTSSATPLVAGVIALMLEKNPNLGYRDVKEILLRSAFKISANDPGWATNSASLSFNHQFGAGLVDATAAVNLATSWTNLALQTTLTTTQSALNVAIPDNNATGITRTFTITESQRVEHATIRLSATHANHRHLEITLTSPSGMVSQLGVSDSSKLGESLTNWTFSSLRHWGENSVGTWTVKIADRTSGTTGSLTLAELQLHGTPAAPVNQAPIITAATLSATTNAFADTPLTIASITATDPESDPITYTYQWQSSTDAIIYTNQPETTSTLASQPDRAAKLWRCLITASDATSTSQPFTTPAVNILTRPATAATLGGTYSYTSGLVLAGNSSTFSRNAIVHEFSQGPSGGTAEWVELLTLTATSLRYFDLQSNGRVLVFTDSPVWDNIPAGCLIVIYNGLVAKDPRLPADDTNPADDTMVISSTNATYFDQNVGDLWLALGNSGDYITLNDSDSNLVHGISYGSNTTVSPNIGAVSSARSAFFNSDQETAAVQTSGWTATSQASSTPAASNNSTNAAYITALRNSVGNSPALFRLAAGITLPSGLTLNPNTGTISGTISINAPQQAYPVTIERFNSIPAVVSHSYTLNISASTTFASWIATHAPISNAAAPADPDADSLPNLVEYALNQNPTTAPTSPAIVLTATATSLQLTYRVHKAHADVTLTPEWSSTLSALPPWSTTEITTTILEDNATSQLRRATLPISPQVPHKFLRLRATTNP